MDSPETLIASARDMVPKLRAQARDSEKARRVSDEIVAAMKSNGFLRITLPRRHGGYELPFSVGIDVELELARGCTSTAWLAGIGLIHQWFLGCFSAEAQDEVWAGEKDLLTAGSYAPVRGVTQVDGGLRITGRWSFASGVDFAAWALLSIVLPEGGSAFVVVPRREWQVIDDWDTVGLAATGSRSVVCDDVFVPAHRMIMGADLVNGTPPGAAVNTGPLWRIPMLAVIPWTLVAPALGALDGAIELFVAEASGRTTRGAVVGGGNRMAQFATVQSRVGEAQGALLAGKALMRDALAKAMKPVDAGITMSRETRIECRLAQAMAVRLAEQGIDALYGAVGGAGLQYDHPIQRAWRDVHAVAKHVSFNWDAVTTMGGQLALGLEPQGQY